MTKPKDPIGPLDDTTQIIRSAELDEKLRRAEKVPSIIVIDGDDSGRVFKLVEHAMSIGRGSAASIRLNDKTVSRKHCLLESAGNAVTVIDLQSANGTFVNGERIQKHRLANSDKIRIGNTMMKFEITDADESEFHERVYQLITFDDLTSLYNRKYLMNRLESLFGARRDLQAVTLLFLDLDHFKQVNDSYDHLTGSDVLSEFGRLLLSNLRATDVACRYGGEEFVIILHDTTAMQAIYVAEKLRKLVENHPFQSKDSRPIQVTVSIGIAEKTPLVKTPDDLIARSDEAMYKAKQNGRNRTVMFTGDEKNPFVLVTPAGLDEETPHGTNV